MKVYFKAMKLVKAESRTRLYLKKERPPRKLSTEKSY